jgi:hypothetical protein
MRRLTALVLVLLATAAAACPKGNEMEPRDSNSSDLRLPRDPDIAVQEELDAARRAGTVAAYDLFVARHGDHRLAGIARQERRKLADRAR